MIGFGTREGLPVVVKVARQVGDEWRCGEVLDAFAGRGVVGAHDYAEGAVLMARLIPGTSLAEAGLADAEATRILADVIRRMEPQRSLPGAAKVRDWAAGFERYLASGDSAIPRNLVERAGRMYLDLCDSQSRPRLLHGDLHHYNVLLDSQRGWLAIDPKGVLGEMEYETGALLRNPDERFATAAIAEQRLSIVTAELNLDYKRARAWGFTQAVLSAIWQIEDGNPSPSLAWVEAMVTG